MRWIIDTDIFALSRNDAVGFGSAVVSTAVFGVSPKTFPVFSFSLFGEGEIKEGLSGETPDKATETVALPNPTASFRLRERAQADL